MADIKVPKTPSAIAKLAQKEFSKKATRNRRNSTISYREGDPSEKVWDNYQLTKQLKRDFKELCAKENINASKYLRSCIRILIKKKGDLKKALATVDKADVSSLTETL